jgi:Fic family protein
MGKIIEKPADEDLRLFCYVSLIFIKQKLIELHNKPSHEIEEHFLLLMTMLIISCSSNIVQNDETFKINKIKDSVNKQKAIDEQIAKGDRPDNEQETHAPAEERKRLINRYNQVEAIDTDTMIVEGNDKLKLKIIIYT